MLWVLWGGSQDLNLFVLDVCVESYYVLDAASVIMNRRDPIFDITEFT